MKKLASIVLVLALASGCTVQGQPQTAADAPPPVSGQSDSPCMDAIKVSAGEAYEYVAEKAGEAYEATKQGIKESQEDGLLKDAGDKLDELKDRAGKAYDALMDE